MAPPSDGSEAARAEATRAEATRPAEPFGVLEVERHVKSDGRGLILYTRRTHDPGEDRPHGRDEPRAGDPEADELSDESDERRSA